jgi:hypothetical protein
VLRHLIDIRYLQSRGIQERRVMLHFGNAPIHNSEGLQKSLTNFGFRRMKDPPYSLDLAPSHFFHRNETGIRMATF